MTKPKDLWLYRHQSRLHRKIGVICTALEHRYAEMRHINLCIRELLSHEVLTAQDIEQKKWLQNRNSQLKIEIADLHLQVRAIHELIHIL